MDDLTDYERELIEDSQPRYELWPYQVDAIERSREPVSERLRLHYIGGAHVGLRGEWARLIREETAALAEIGRLYARLRREMRAVDTNHVNWTPASIEERFGHLLRPRIDDDEVIF